MDAQAPILSKTDSPFSTSSVTRHILFFKEGLLVQYLLGDQAPLLLKKDSSFSTYWVTRHPYF